LENYFTIGDKAFTVINFYPFQYDMGAGKEVLRMDIPKAAHSYTEIETALECPDADIFYYENGEHVGIYKGYVRNFKCSFANGIFSVELTRITATERELAEVKTRLAAAEDAILFVLNEGAM